MLHKLTLAFVAAASLGATLIPSAASAASTNGIVEGDHFWLKSKHEHKYSRFFFGGPIYASGGYDDPCYVRRLVWTPYGYKYRLVNRCY